MGLPGLDDLGDGGAALRGVPGVGGMDMGGMMQVGRRTRCTCFWVGPVRGMHTFDDLRRQRDRCPWLRRCGGWCYMAVRYGRQALLLRRYAICLLGS